jgi:hypothetical protein
MYFNFTYKLWTNKMHLFWTNILINVSYPNIYIQQDVMLILIYIILIYIQKDATLHWLYYLETALHILGCTTTHHQERKQLYLQHLLFVTPLLLSAAIVEEF